MAFVHPDQASLALLLAPLASRLAQQEHALVGVCCLQHLGCRAQLSAELVQDFSAEP